MTIQTVLNVTQTALVIDTAGHTLGGREPYLYDDATISPTNFAIIQTHINGGRLRLLTGGVTIPAPTDGASFVSVTVVGQNLVFTDSLGGTSTVAVPGGDIDLSAYATTASVAAAVADKVTTTDLSTGLAAKVNSATYTAGIAAKADTTAVGALAAAAQPVREAFLPGLGQFELQPMFVTGHSWQAVDTNATPGARWYQRVARRIGITGTPTNKAQSGRTVQDITVATLSGTNGWTPRTKALVGLACTINDVTIYDGSAAARRGYQWAWTSLLSQLTANAAIACNTANFVYSSGWTSSAVSVSTAQAANTNSTGGRWFRTTTVGSYFEFAVTGGAVDVFLVARAAGAGLCTFTVAGATVGTLNLTQPSAQDTIAVAQLRGLGSGTVTVRGTLTSGASLTVDSIRIPAADPVPGIVLGEPNVIPTNVDHATYLADVETLKGDLATIVAGFPTFRYVDLNGPGWDTTTMLTEDGKHPNDAGCAYIASRCMPVLAALPYSKGLNVLGTTAVPTYTAPTPPAIPATGQDGTGASAPGSTAPTAMTLTAVPGDGQVVVTPSGATGQTSYTLYRGTDATGTVLSTTFAAFTDTGRTNGTLVNYYAVASNAGGSVTAAASATPAAGPAQPTITDDFNRTNSALNGSTTSTGTKTWVTSPSGAAVIGIVSNQVKVTSGTGNAVSSVDAAATTGDVQMTLKAVSGTLTTMISGLALRFTDDANYISVQIRSDSNNNNGPANRYAITERLAGTPTLLAKATDAVPTVGDVVRAEVRGSTVRVLVNGVEVIPATTVTNTTGTKFGIYGNGADTVTQWDDWSYTPAV